MPIVLNGTTGITTPTYNGSTTAEYLVPVTGFKNRIINGAMVIDQRNAGASVTLNDGVYPVDRFRGVITQSSKLTAQQLTSSPPVGFTNYLGITSSSAYSVVSGDTFSIQQRIEGFNVADLGWGTANAKTVTLSAWVYSSLTGTFGGALLNSANTRSYPFSYTISSANTWTQISVTIAGDTSGTWVTNNGIGIKVGFGLGSGATYSGTANAWAGAEYYAPTGATSVVGTSGATFYITGVQLEVGSTATSFDYRPYGTELALCQRYFQRMTLGGGAGLVGYNDTTTRAIVYYYFPVQLRGNPTLTTTGTASDYAIRWANVNFTVCSAVPTIVNPSVNSARVDCTVASGLTVGYGSQLSDNATGTWLGFNSEL